MVAGLYSNTHVMTGDVPCGAGSSAVVICCNDIVTCPDNTSEPLDLKILPLPQNENCQKERIPEWVSGATRNFGVPPALRILRTGSPRGTRRARAIR